jgi:hypothetical protein
VPVSLEELGDKKIVDKLQRLTPEKVLKDIEKYKEMLYVK